MSTFALSIINSACILSGISVLVNFDKDKSEVSQVAREKIESVIREVLTSGNFECTRKTIPLTLVGSPDRTELANGYHLPPDFTRLIGLTDCCDACGSKCYNNVSVNYNITFRILNDMLYIDSPCCFCCCGSLNSLVYISSNIGTSVVSSYLESAMAHLLAYYLCHRFKGSTEAKDMYNMYKKYVGQALELQNSENHPYNNLSKPCKGKIHWRY